MFGVKAKHYTTVAARVVHADGTVTDRGIIATDMPWWVRLFRKVVRDGKR